MRDYGKISTTIWNSQKFCSLPTDDTRLLYFYLHTCPHVNSVGCFVLRSGYAAEDLQWETERYQEALDSLSKANLVRVDRAERLVKIVNFLAFDPFTNAKHAKGAIKIALSLPDCQIKLLLLQEIAGSRHVNDDPDLTAAIDSLSIAYRNPEPEPEPKAADEARAHTPAREASPPDPVDPQADTWRENLCGAMGHDPTSLSPGGRIPGNSNDMEEARRWVEDLGLTKIEVLRKVEEVAAKKTGGPPSSFKYFTDAMRELAAQKAAPKLEPEPQSQHRQPNGGFHGKPSHRPDRFQRIVKAAAGGTSSQDWG